jgi:hypothetical protein
MTETMDDEGLAPEVAARLVEWALDREGAFMAERSSWVRIHVDVRRHDGTARRLAEPSGTRVAGAITPPGPP